MFYFLLGLLVVMLLLLLEKCVTECMLKCDRSNLCVFFFHMQHSMICLRLCILVFLIKQCGVIFMNSLGCSVFQSPAVVLPFSFQLTGHLIKRSIYESFTVRILQKKHLIVVIGFKLLLTK